MANNLSLMFNSLIVMTVLVCLPDSMVNNTLKPLNGSFQRCNRPAGCGRAATLELTLASGPWQNHQNAQ